MWRNYKFVWNSCLQVTQQLDVVYNCTFFGTEGRNDRLIYRLLRNIQHTHEIKGFPWQPVKMRPEKMVIGGWNEESNELMGGLLHANERKAIGCDETPVVDLKINLKVLLTLLPAPSWLTSEQRTIAFGIHTFDLSQRLYSIKPRSLTPRYEWEYSQTCGISWQLRECRNQLLKAGGCLQISKTIITIQSETTKYVTTISSFDWVVTDQRELWLVEEPGMSQWMSHNAWL